MLRYDIKRRNLEDETFSNVVKLRCNYDAITVSLSSTFKTIILDSICSARYHPYRL